jgi:exopolysaccharide production protein ExoZ
VTRLHSVQILRLAAATLVVCQHAYLPFRIGCFGVDLFFVISGFIMANVAAERSAGQFLVARARRIYPIYWLWMAPWVVLALAGGLWSWPRLIGSLTLWPLVDGYQLPYLKVAWTLMFEALFYLAMGVSRLGQGVGRFVLLAYFAALAGHLAFPEIIALRFLGAPIIIEFLLGIAVAKLPRGPAWLAVLGVAGVLAIIPLAPRLAGISAGVDPWRPIFAGPPAALILAGVLRLERYARRLPWLSYGGDASYSIYLCHPLVIAFSPALFVVQVGASLAVGVLSFRYLEAPLLRWLSGSAAQRIRITAGGAA